MATSEGLVKRAFALSGESMQPEMTVAGPATVLSAPPSSLRITWLPVSAKKMAPLRGSQVSPLGELRLEAVGAPVE